jgi:glycosyltransferase involved in cell wall biosynthesis
MHIAFYTNTYLPVMSGVVQSIHIFRNALTGCGNNVFIFAQHAEGHRDTEPFIFRYPAFSLPMQQKYPVTLPVSPYINWLLPSLKLDVIHAHHPFLLGETAAEKAVELNVPLVFTHHTRYSDYSHYIPLNQTLVKTAIEDYLADYMIKCHHIVVPSESIKEKLGEVYGIINQITAIPTGMELALWAKIDGSNVRQNRGWGQDTVLISVGRLAKEKNWPMLLTAVAQVMQTRPKVRLVLIGDGDERKSLEKLTQELGITARVEFTGNLPHEQVIACLKAADLFCFASTTETQGMVTGEAMAAGLPVVAVNATGTRDVLTHQQEGLLTANTSEALAQAILQVLADDAARQRYQAAALERAKTLDIEAQAQKMLEVYTQAIEDQRAGRYVQLTAPALTMKKSKRWRETFEQIFGFELI